MNDSRSLPPLMGMPDAPEASSKAMSLVLVWSSMVTALKLASEADLSNRCNSGGAILASVVRYASIVACLALAGARRGPIIPLPLQTPAMVIGCLLILKSAADVLRRVSVVRMVSAKSSACSSLLPRYFPASAMPCWTLSMGKRWPMMPVEAGMIWLRLQVATAAARSHICLASRSPCAPVHALALPLLTTAPRDCPERMCCRASVTGAATTLLVVNSAAAAAGASLSSSPTSGAWRLLIPA